MEPIPASLAADAGNWRIHLLGEFRVERLGRRASFRTQKTASLLSYVAFYQGKILSREALAEMFWPESEPALGRQSLRMALSDIRSELRCADWDPDRFFIGDRNTIEILDGTFWSDWKILLSALESASEDVEKVREAVSLYSGRFLQSSDEPWVYPQALEIEERYAQAVCYLVPALARRGELAEAINIGRRAISLCAPREDLHACLISAYSQSGQAPAALRQYEELESMLDSLWGERPSEATYRLLSDLPRGIDVNGSNPVLTSEDFSTSDSTQFVGREAELAELVSVLDPSASGPRLWTIIGLGGTGKTRLALRAAEALRSLYSGRVHVVGFENVQTSNQMWDSLAHLASSRSQDEGAILDALAARIGPQATLIIADNVEQITEPVALAMGALIDRCPALRVLTTSRIPLGSPAERLLRLLPLSLPAPGCSIDELRRSPSVMLFTDAAQSSRYGFTVNANNAEGVRLLCEFLEGLPLALVLAAARLGTQTPTQVAASLSRRADLSGALVGIRARHQNLEAVVQWSFDQLSDDERSAFLKLAYCRGDFDVALASALLGNDAVTLLEKFSRHALLSWEEAEDALRYRMLETIREVGSEELEDKPWLLAESIERHSIWVLEFAKTKPKSDAILAESSHILSVLEAGSEGRLDAASAWRAAEMVQVAVAQTGRAYLWIDALEKLLAETQANLAPEVAASAFGIVADAQYAARNIQRCYTLLEQAIDAAERSGDPRLRISTLVRLRIPATLLGEYSRAKRGLEQAYELAKGTPLIAEVAAGLGWLELCQDHADVASKYFADASNGVAELSDPVRAEFLTGWATALACQQDPLSEMKFAESERALEAANVPDLTARHRYFRAWSHSKNGRLDDAESDIAECLRIYQENGIALGQTPLTIAGIILSKAGRHEYAHRAWARSESARQSHSMSMLPMLEVDYRDALERSSTTPGDSRWNSSLKMEASRTDLEFMAEVFPERVSSG